MDNPTELVEIKEEHSHVQIKHEEVCFELIEEHNVINDLEGKNNKNLVSNNIKKENKEFSEHEDFDGTGQSEEIEFVKDEGEMSCDWNEHEVNEPDPLAFVAVQSIKVEHIDEENKEETLTTIDASPNTSKENHGLGESSRFKKHQGIRKNANAYKCLVCSYSSSRKIDVKIHLRTHTGEKPFKCVECNFLFSRNDALKRHLRLHTGVKTFKCLECDYAVSTKYDLKRHLRIHTGEKLFKCMECNQVFSTSSHLTVHTRQHTGEKLYKCFMCNYESARKQTLKSHIRIHTGEKPFKCSVCDYSSARKIDVTVHLRTHTGEKPYKCSVCNYASATRTTLKRHFRIHTREKPSIL